MNKSGFSDKDVFEWIKIIATIILGYVIITALLSLVN